MSLARFTSPLRLVVVGLLVGLTVTACNSDNGAGPDELSELQVGIASPFFSAAWDQPVGPETVPGVQFSQFDGAGPVYEALRAGAVDIGFGSDISAIASQSSAANFKIFAVATPSPNWLRLIVPEGSTATTLNDLRGKSIAVVKGSAAQRFLITTIQQAGLVPEDFNINYLATADAQAAFRKGSIDAWAAWEPNAAQLEKDSGAKLITTANVDTAGSIYLAGAADLFDDSNPKSATAKAFLSTFIAKLDQLKANSEQWAQVLASQFKLSPTASLQYAENYTFTFGPVDDAARVQYTETAQDLRQLGVITNPPAESDPFITTANSTVEAAVAIPAASGK